MATITLKGNTIHSVGELPAVGDTAKDFALVNADLTRVLLADFSGSRLVLNIFPSLDTGTCAASVRRFNKIAGELKDTKVLCISRDLPLPRNVSVAPKALKMLLHFPISKQGVLEKNYGLEIADGPLKGLHSRVVVVVDSDGKVSYTQQVPEIVDEPDYDHVLEHLK